MIIGIGTDLCDQRRIARVYARHGDQFARRILMPEELDAFTTAKKPDNFLAKAWACKEAVAKALGTGFSGIAHDDIGMLRAASGAPRVILSTRGQQRVSDAGGTRVHVSISDEPPLVQAFAVIERVAG